jgi:hypothetical protein
LVFIGRSVRGAGVFRKQFEIWRSRRGFRALDYADNEGKTRLCEVLFRKCINRWVGVFLFFSRAVWSPASNLSAILCAKRLANHTMSPRHPPQPPQPITHSPTTKTNPHPYLPT